MGAESHLFYAILKFFFDCYSRSTSMVHCTDCFKDIESSERHSVCRAQKLFKSFRHEFRFCFFFLLLGLASFMRQPIKP